jgi:hypothetical protein
MQTSRPALVPLLILLAIPALAKPPKVHTVTLGPVRKVPYTPPQATPDTKSEDSSTLRIRPLVIDGVQKEWTLGEVHDVTDRTFVIRRALRINDSLPAEPVRWAWQPGPWLMVDRISGHITSPTSTPSSPTSSGSATTQPTAASPRPPRAASSPSSPSSEPASPSCKNSSPPGPKPLPRIPSAPPPYGSAPPCAPPCS